MWTKHGGRSRLAGSWRCSHYLERGHLIQSCTKCPPRSYLNSIGTSEKRNARKPPQQRVQYGRRHLDAGHQQNRQERRLRMLQETYSARAKGQPAVRKAPARLRQGGSVEGGQAGGGGEEANFICVTIKLGLKITFFLDQPLPFSHSILKVFIGSDFESDFAGSPLSAHAPLHFYQLWESRPLEGGSGQSKGKGGTELPSHEHAKGGAGRRRKRMPRVGLSEDERQDSQSARELPFGRANELTPRAQCLATRAFQCLVWARWAASGYKNLRRSWQPPFWGSFRGKLWSVICCGFRCGHIRGSGRWGRGGFV